MLKKISRYSLIGGVGFATDMISFLLMMQLGVMVYFSRAMAFVIAVQVTYSINSRWTFVNEKGNKSKYFIGQLLGVFINYAVFFISYEYFFSGRSIIAFCMGSGVALVFNFLIANYWAFNNNSVAN